MPSPVPFSVGIWGVGLYCGGLFKDVWMKKGGGDNKQDNGKEEQRNSPIYGKGLKSSDWLTRGAAGVVAHPSSTQGRGLGMAQQGVLWRHFKLLVKFSLVPPTIPGQLSEGLSHSLLKSVLERTGKEEKLE